MRKKTDAERIVACFNSCFQESEKTVLVAGGDEPIYLPTDTPNGVNQIVFTQDYAASARHEVAHWCIAGRVRRQQTDYGYWYEPDGRSQIQQALFETVEVKPQALEWLFSVACRRKFQISADNLDGDVTPSPTFAENIYSQVREYCAYTPQRARTFAQSLATEFEAPWPLAARQFSLSDII